MDAEIDGIRGAGHAQRQKKPPGTCHDGAGFRKLMYASSLRVRALNTFIFSR